MPKANKVKLFFRLHWIKLLVVLGVSLLLTSLTVFISMGFNEWGTVDGLTKQRTIAGFPFQLYMAIIQVFLFGLMWFFLGSGGAYRSFMQLGKSSVRGEEIGVKWSDIIGMDEVKKEAVEVVRLIKERAAVEKSGSQILIILGRAATP